MDIIDKLLAACIGYPVTNIPWPHRVLHDAAEEITRLRAELAECKQDAERYRWLRDKCRDGSLTIARADDWSLHPWSGDDIDKEIDAARKGEGE